jgi:hypothetical protein
MTLFKLNIINNDIRAIVRSLMKGSLIPIFKRSMNKWIGRNIVRRLWIR